MVDLKALANECGVDLYDVESVNENSRLIYRIYINKKGGVSLDDCENFSRLLSPIYDVEPPVNGDYVLEVSSPGLERKLSKEEHFKNSLGELVKISTINKENFEGELLGFEDSRVEIKTDDGIKKIDFKDIKKAKTFIQW